MKYVVPYIQCPICFPVAKYMFYVVKHKLGDNLHKSCTLVVRFVSQVVVYYIDYGELYIEAFELEKEIRLLETFIILHDLCSYVLDLILWLHQSCISVQTQAFGSSYVNHVV